MAHRLNLEETKSLRKLLSESMSAEISEFETLEKDQSGGDASTHIAKQRSQNNYKWREKNGTDEIRARSTHNSEYGGVGLLNSRINTIENVESLKAFDRLQSNNNLMITYEDVTCKCLEKLHLKIESELDRLRGLFRKREQDLFHPLSHRL